MRRALSNLDADLRERMRLEISALVREAGATTVYITHEQAEAFALADRVGVLERGRLVQQGTPEEIYTQPATPVVARFTGLSGELPVHVLGRAADGSMDVELAGTAQARPFRARGPGLPIGEAAALLMIRPTGVQLCPSGTGEHHVIGTVADVAFRGRGYEHAVDIPGHARLTSVFSGHAGGTRRTRRAAPGSARLPSVQRPARGRPCPPRPAARPRRPSRERRRRRPRHGRPSGGTGPTGRPPCATRDRPARAGASIRAVTTTLTLSTSAPSAIDADAVVIGVIKGEDGPVLAPGAADLDQALNGTLAATLATLGATGQAEEVTRLPASAPVTAPVIAAVRAGPGRRSRP